MKPLRALPLLLLSAAPACAADLMVEVEARWQDRPLALADLSLKNAAGNEMSVTRLAYLLSAAKLQREDGKWIGAGNWQAFLNVEQKRTSFTLNGVPAAKYQALRFDLGLDAATDKSDPAKRPAGHALHPDVNGLHWSWRGGYVFLAIEGRWRQADGTDGGYSYHLAGEPCRGTVEVRAELDLRGAVKMTLVLDAAKIFNAAHRIDIKAADSTHSANDGGLAERMADNAVAAFSLRSIVPLVDPTPRPPTMAVTSPGGVNLTIPSHFPQVTWPADNPLKREGVALGKRLFNEPLLSVTGTQSCASCHKVEAGFSDSLPVSLGAQGQKGVRNSMPLANLAWKPSFFWDGRVATLREQVLQPIQDPLEMNEKLDRVMEKLKADETYPAAFEKVFGSPGITPERLGMALEQFLLTMIGGKSKLDRSLYGGATLTDEERRGFELFFTESDPARGIRGADCFHCHGGAHFTNNSFANNGLDADNTRKDEGRSKFTGASGDRGKFVVPSLRNVARTAPYMHDGRFQTLEEVIEHYDHGIIRSATLDPNIAKHLSYGGLGLKPEEKKALIAFLRTLTEEE